MTKSTALVCSVLALCLGLALVPAVQAAESGDAMHKDAMMHKGHMKKHKKDSMHGDAMKHEGAALQQ